MLGIAFLHKLVPLRFCSQGLVSPLLDFEGILDPPAMEPPDGGNLATREGSTTFEFRWSLEQAPDDSFVVFSVPALAVDPCDILSCDVEVDADVTLRIELKTIEEGSDLPVIRDVRSALVRGGALELFEIPVTQRYVLR